MKKVILSALILGTSIVAVPAIEAKTTSNALTNKVDPQVRIQIGRNRRDYRRYRRVRTVTTTRIVRTGFRTFRETIRTTYLPNGATRTVVVNRERVR